MLTFVQYITSSFGLVIFLFFTIQLIASRLNIWKIFALSYSLGLISLLKSQLEWDSLPFMIINAIAFIILICILIFAYTEKPLKRCAVFGYFLVVWFLSDAISVAIFTLRYGDTGRILSELSVYWQYICLSLTIFILLGSISVLAWRMIAARKFQPFYLLFFILPVGQAITVYSFMFSAWTAYWALGVMLSLAADLILLAYTISQEKKTELEEELRETRHQMELEQYHYREVEQRREELVKIRHDFNNQLASVARLVRSGEDGPAQELIRSLSTEINDTKENTYCAIPVVNAVLTEKAKECAGWGIDLNVELDIPVPLSVEQMHLCSIFSNLLDNAISACKQIAGGGKAEIKLFSKVDGDYLFIKAENPSNKPSKKPLPGRGYGSRILTDLAARYGGNYQGEYRSGTYTAVISLLAVAMVDEA